MDRHRRHGGLALDYRQFLCPRRHFSSRQRFVCCLVRDRLVYHPDGGSGRRVRSAAFGRRKGNGHAGVSRCAVRLAFPCLADQSARRSRLCIGAGIGVVRHRARIKRGHLGASRWVYRGRRVCVLLGTSGRRALRQSVRCDCGRHRPGHRVLYRHPTSAHRRLDSVPGRAPHLRGSIRADSARPISSVAFIAVC